MFISRENRKSYVIGADQICISKGKIFSKPKNKKKAINLLSTLVKNDSEHISAYLQLGNLLRDENTDRAIEEASVQTGVKIVDYTGDFAENQRITGVISKSSGIITDLKIARGVLEIGSITRTTGQFIDDVGKPSEIIQKIQDSYYYQDFSYAVKSAVSIGEWKDIPVSYTHLTLPTKA